MFLYSILASGGFKSYLPTIVLIIAGGTIWLANVIKAKNTIKQEKQDQIAQIIEEHDNETALRDEFKDLHNRFDEVFARLDNIEDRLQRTDDKVNILTDSDKHDIKSWIVEQYHKFYIHQGWIDAFSAETIDSRFDDYRKEGGNSYVENLVKQIHTLSMDPEDSIKKDN